MIRIKAEGYGAEWIEIPDDVLELFADHPEFYSNGQICGEVVFVTSRSDQTFHCSFQTERKIKGETIRVLEFSSTYGSDKIPTWVAWHGVPQFLFDNIFKGFLACRAAVKQGGYLVLSQEKS